ncbi:MAG: acyltransferase [Acidobacteriota bacterium]
MSSFFAHPTAVIDDGCSIGDDTKIWHFCHVMPGATIGEKCSLGQNVFVANDVTIGNGVKIQNNVSVYEGVVLDDYVFCGPSMVFTNVSIPRAAFPRNTKDDYLRTHVGTGASLGANCTIVCGNSIGAWSFIAAGAVVTKDVPAYALMAGVPARRIGWACKCGHTLRGQGTDYECGECGRRYRDSGVELELAHE